MREEVIAYEPPTPLLLQAALRAAGARPRRHRRADPGGGLEPGWSTRSAPPRPCRRRLRLPRRSGSSSAIKQLLDGVAKESERRARDWLSGAARGPRAEHHRPAAVWKPQRRLHRQPRAGDRPARRRAIVLSAPASLAYELLKRPRRRPQLATPPSSRRSRRRRRRKRRPSTGRSSGSTRPAPATSRRRDQAPVSPALALLGAAAARVPAGLRPRPALRGQQQRLRLRPRREHRQGSLGTPDRRAQRLFAGVPQGSSVHRQPRPGPRPQARREDRQGSLETPAAGTRRVLAAGTRKHSLFRL